ncbi:MAG: sensor histidine kinase [Actinomycetota bacterium]|nr:sensor histidine kinase [Actinomycetota bacterium]
MQERQARALIGAVTGEGPPWYSITRPGSDSLWVRDAWLWRVVSGAFLLWLLPDAIGLWQSGHVLVYRLVVLALLVIFAGVYLMVWPSGGRPSPSSLRWWVTLAVLGVTLAGLLGPGSIGVLMYVLISGAAVLPTNRAFVLLWTTMAGMALYTGLSQQGTQWSEIVIFGSITLMMIALMGNVRAIRELQAAREEVARLAVADERGRIARDLHDVLGHNLTTITVKAALARKLLERGETKPAAVEIGDVERLSRQSLTDVRATVSAQRKASLPAELAGARAVLTAAGIEPVLPQATENVRPEYSEVFAYVLREAVTNVVRHSGATRCAVSLGASWLDVTDDGTGLTSTVEGPTGNGLNGIRERLNPLGGSLRVGRAPGGGFQLRAFVGAP